MSTTQPGSVHERWAQLRFAVVGHLLASPPKPGELMAHLRGLAENEWTHPSTGSPVQFGVSTIERWYYQAKNEPLDPVSRLKRRPRKDIGQVRGMTPELRQALVAQYQRH